jgi:NAD-dependent SIR2 family protein deacetylase
VDDFGQLRELVQSSKKIVVISGASISVNAGYKLKLIYGILYRCWFNLVPTFEDIWKSKQSSFYRSLYSSLYEIIRFYSIVCDIFDRLYSDLTEPLLFYKVMDELAQSRPYFQYYMQNINCLEQLLPNLKAKIVRLYN